jgi:hypothetical protein
MGFPAMSARAFPGKREEANRAGITPRIVFGTIDLSTVEGEEKPRVRISGDRAEEEYRETA